MCGLRNIGITTVNEDSVAVCVAGGDHVLRADWTDYHRSGAQDGKQVLFHRVTHKISIPAGLDYLSKGQPPFA